MRIQNRRVLPRTTPSGEPLRILLVGMPRILREIIREIIASEKDMEIVGERTDIVALPAETDRTRARFVIGAANGPDAVAEYHRLLYERPHLQVLLVENNGRRGVLHELRPHAVPISAMDSVAPTELIEAIRSATESWSASPWMDP